MNQAAEQLPLKSIVGQLRMLCERHRTGTFLIATSDNRSARFVLERGQVLSASYARLQGLQAVEAIRGVSGGRCSFHTQVMMRRNGEQNLPDSAGLLEMLETGAMAVPPSPESERNDVQESELSPSMLKDVLESELADFVGPMASLICDEHLQSLPIPARKADVAVLIDRIALETGDSRKAAQFRERVMSKLD